MIRAVAHKAGAAPRRAMALRGLLLGTVLVSLAACGQREPILPGERLDLDEVRTGLAAQDLEIGARAFAAPAVVQNSAWSQSPASPAARTTNPAWAGALETLWRVPIGQGDKLRARIIVDPVVADGRIFVMDSANMLSAVATSGALLWQRDLTPARDRAGAAQGGGFAVADGVLYVASGFGRLFALDATSGEQLWLQKLEGAATGAPSVAGDLVYVTSAQGTAWAVERGNGRVRWQIEASGDVNNRAGAPAPAISGDKVVFAFGASNLQGVFRRGAYSLWTSQVLGRRTGVALAYADDVTGGPVISGQRVFASNGTGQTVALNLTSGETLWSLTEGATGPVWPAGDSVFLVSDTNQLIRADASTGTVIWRQDLPQFAPRRMPSRLRDEAYVHHGPVLAGGKIVVAGTDGMIRVFAPEDGRLLREAVLDGGATTRPALADGVMYVVSRDGDLVALR